jgi:hypothetical protein
LGPTIYVAIVFKIKKLSRYQTSKNKEKIFVTNKKMYRNVQNKFFKISLILATGSGSNPDPDPQPWF